MVIHAAEEEWHDSIRVLGLYVGSLQVEVSTWAWAWTSFGTLTAFCQSASDKGKGLISTANVVGVDSIKPPFLYPGLIQRGDLYYRHDPFL